MMAADIAVRCCCTPTKILGHWPAPASALGRGRWFTVLDKSGQVKVIEFREFQHADGHREMAVYSDSRDIDFWRSIPGFKEATT